jgi:Right handed beta helix region
MKNPARLRATGRACVAAAALAAVALLSAACPGSTRAEVAATPATLDGVFDGAAGGQTILLAAGDYGVFEGGMKDGMVTLRPQPGATVRMNLRFNPASNITIDGVTLEHAEIANSRTKNIVVRNADIPGQVIFKTGELANANILLDGNDHHDFTKCGDCPEGRISLMENTAQPAGITIRNSEFRGGMSDGIQNGANGLRILNNVFHDLVPGTPQGVHTDAIQLYGSRNTLIRGNYFYDVRGQQIMAPDGADHEVIEDNVIAGDPDGYPFVISLGSDDGSIIRHNTFPEGRCAFHLSCGIIALSAKDGQPKGRGTVIKDNVLGGAVSIQDGSGAAEISHNLIAGPAAAGRNARGSALFVGGSRPSTYAGYALAAGSPGKGRASDGGDPGIRPSGDTGPRAASTKATGSGVSVRVLGSLRTIARTARLRLRIGVREARTLVLSGRIRPGRRAVRTGGTHSRRAIGLKARSVTFRAPGRRTVALRLAPAAARILGRSRDARLSLRVYADARRRQPVAAVRRTVRR